MAAPKASPRHRRVRRLLAFAAGVFSLLSLGVVVEMWSALGVMPSGKRLERMAESPRFREGRFVNELPMEEPEVLPTMVEWIKGRPNTTPDAPPPIVERRRTDFDRPPASGLRITWLGHSTLLIEIDGLHVLTDPVWGERSSPSAFFGPKRFHPPPLPFHELPELDVVVISHDHYDHLDALTIEALADTDVPFVAPLGVGAHLESWGVSPERITELDWWGETTIGDLRLVATPARHFSGRGLRDRDKTLWAGWAMVGPEHRLYYSGDTGFFPGFAEIGERLGPFDVTMIEVGAYNPMWRDVHLGPEQALVAHQMLGGGLMLPVHWGTFDLALHPWTEPVERLLASARARGVRVVVPQAGQSVEPSAPPPIVRWWPEVPWDSAEQSPRVVSSHLDDGVVAAILGPAATE